MIVTFKSVGKYIYFYSFIKCSSAAVVHTLSFDLNFVMSFGFPKIGIFASFP